MRRCSGILQIPANLAAPDRDDDDDYSSVSSEGSSPPAWTLNPNTKRGWQHALRRIILRLQFTGGITANHLDLKGRFKRPISESENHAISKVLRSEPLMYGCSRILSRAREALMDSKVHTVEVAMNLLCKAIHETKVNTTRTMFNDLLEPNQRELKDANTKIEVGKKRFDEARVQYLKEIVMLRDAGRPGLAAGLGDALSTNEKCAFDPTCLLQPHECQFATDVVVEKLRMIFGSSATYHGDGILQKIEQLVDNLRTVEISRLQGEVARMEKRLTWYKNLFQVNQTTENSRQDLLHQLFLNDQLEFKMEQKEEQVQKQQLALTRLQDELAKSNKALEDCRMLIHRNTYEADLPSGHTSRQQSKTKADTSDLAKELSLSQGRERKAEETMKQLRERVAELERTISRNNPKGKAKRGDRRNSACAYTADDIAEYENREREYEKREQELVASLKEANDEVARLADEVARLKKSMDSADGVAEISIGRTEATRNLALNNLQKQLKDARDECARLREEQSTEELQSLLNEMKHLQKELDDTRRELEWSQAFCDLVNEQHFDPDADVEESHPQKPVCCHKQIQTAPVLVEENRPIDCSEKHTQTFEAAVKDVGTQVRITQAQNDTKKGERQNISQRQLFQAMTKLRSCVCNGSPRSKDPSEEMLEAVIGVVDHINDAIGTTMPSKEVYSNIDCLSKASELISRCVSLSDVIWEALAEVSSSLEKVAEEGASQREMTASLKAQLLQMAEQMRSRTLCEDDDNLRHCSSILEASEEKDLLNIAFDKGQAAETCAFGILPTLSIRQPQTRKLLGQPELSEARRSSVNPYEPIARKPGKNLTANLNIAGSSVRQQSLEEQSMTSQLSTRVGSSDSESSSQAGTPLGHLSKRPQGFRKVSISARHERRAKSPDPSPTNAPLDAKDRVSTCPDLISSSSLFCIDDVQSDDEIECTSHSERQTVERYSERPVTSERSTRRKHCALSPIRGVAARKTTLNQSPSRPSRFLSFSGGSESVVANIGGDLSRPGSRHVSKQLRGDASDPSPRRDTLDCQSNPFCLKPVQSQEFPDTICHDAFEERRNSSVDGSISSPLSPLSPRRPRMNSMFFKQRGGGGSKDCLTCQR